MAEKLGRREDGAVFRERRAELSADIRSLDALDAGEKVGRVFSRALRSSVRAVRRRLHRRERVAVYVVRSPRCPGARRAHGGPGRVRGQTRLALRARGGRGEVQARRGYRGAHRPVRPRKRAEPAHRVSILVRRDAVENAGAHPRDHGGPLRQHAPGDLRERGLRADVRVVHFQLDGILPRLPGESRVRDRGAADRQGHSSNWADSARSSSKPFYVAGGPGRDRREAVPPTRLSPRGRRRRPRRGSRRARARAAAVPRGTARQSAPAIRVVIHPTRLLGNPPANPFPPARGTATPARASTRA